MFEPSAVPFSFGALRSWLADQLRIIADTLAAPTVRLVTFAQLAAEPERFDEGDIVWANGTDWNPGSGAGLYERRGGAWEKL
jgi:hypothetical protein